jgi:hypothetical protein
MSSPMTMRVEGPAPEGQISKDLIRRGLMIAPLLVGICAAVWGAKGAAGSGYGLGLVLINFAVSAALLVWTARISVAVMMGAALFGYLIRLGLILIAVLLVRNASWISLPALGLTIIATHLGLLFWELRHISASLAFPGLKPRPNPTN